MSSPSQGFLESKNPKPVDRWLAILGIVLGLIFHWLPKTPLLIVSTLVLIAALLARPIWNLWWVEEQTWRRVLAYLLVLAVLVGLGCAVWPGPAATSARAYLQVTRLRLADMEARPGGLRPKVEVYFHNVGTAPAVPDFLGGDVFFIPDVPSEAEKTIFSRFEHTIDRSEFAAGPAIGIGDARVLVMPVPNFHTDVEANQWINGGKWIYVVGLLSYKDGNGEHSTEFCYFLKPPNLRMEMPSSSNPLDINGNWIQCSVHNEIK